MKRLVCLALLLLAGCRVKPCKNGTLLLTLDFDARSAAADSLAVSVTYDDGSAARGTIAHVRNQASGTVELDFDKGYPAKKQVTVLVTALAAQTPLGSGSASFVLDAQCTSHTLSITGAGGPPGDDMAMSGDVDQGMTPADMAGADMAGADMAQSCVTNPVTYKDILNACTGAQSVDIEPYYPAGTPGGALPPLN